MSATGLGLDTATDQVYLVYVYKTQKAFFSRCVYNYFQQSLKLQRDNASHNGLCRRLLKSGKKQGNIYELAEKFI